jgi:hypothetical protein
LELKYGSWTWALVDKNGTGASVAIYQLTKIDVVPLVLVYCKWSSVSLNQKVDCFDVTA